MNANIVSKENNVVKFTFQASAEKLEEGLKYSYNKNKNNIGLPGFRKGKAPRKLIEAQYGEGIFYDDAINFVLNEEYDIAVKELGLNIVSKPEIDVAEMDKAVGITFSAEATVKPEVTLGQYKALEVEKADMEVASEAIEEELKKLQNQNARTITVTDRAAKLDDMVTISYLGTVDGVAFDGGQSDSHELTLGSHAFIEGFEEQIVGHSTGDKLDVNVTFPTEYHAKELSGKAAVFAVEVKEISMKELPELNDEFAQDVSEFETLDEYKASIMAKLKTDKETQAKQLQGDKLLDTATANATMDVPAVMYENKIDQLMKDFEQNLGRQGLSIEVYCQYMGTTNEGLRETFKGTAKKSVDARLMLEQIVIEEKLTIEATEVDAQIEKIGEGYGMKEGQMIDIITGEDRDALEHDMLIQKAITLIEDAAIEVESAK